LILIGKLQHTRPAALPRSANKRHVVCLAMIEEEKYNEKQTLRHVNASNEFQYLMLALICLLKGNQGIVWRIKLNILAFRQNN